MVTLLEDGACQRGCRRGETLPRGMD